jgi:hypothetical protein
MKRTAAANIQMIPAFPEIVLVPARLHQFPAQNSMFMILAVITLAKAARVPMPGKASRQPLLAPAMQVTVLLLLL